MSTQALHGRMRWVSVRGRPGAVPLGAILGGAGVAATLAIGLLHLDRLPLTVCTFRAFTGWPCMTCGATRALGLLFHLDVPAALAMNPLATLGVLGLLPWALADLALLPWGRALDVDLAPALARAARVALVAAVVLNWIYLLAMGR